MLSKHISSMQNWKTVQEKKCQILNRLRRFQVLFENCSQIMRRNKWNFIHRNYLDLLYFQKYVRKRFYQCWWIIMPLKMRDVKQPYIFILSKQICERKGNCEPKFRSRVSIRKASESDLQQFVYWVVKMRNVTLGQWKTFSQWASFGNSTL